MQSLYLLGRSSGSDCRGGGGGGGGGWVLSLPSRRFASFLGMWAHRRKPSDRTSPVAAEAGGGDQDHYAVLGVSSTATAGDIKRAYRLLARKYHPDVSRDVRGGEVFKSIRLAYEVLSDEFARARYDMSFKAPEPRSNSWRTTRRAHNPEYDEILYRWAKLKHHMQYEKHDKDEESTWYYQTNSHQETSNYERAPFSEVLRFSFFTFFFMQMVGHRASLALCGAFALLDNQLDVGYKMGYVVAWLFGGRGGVLLAICIYFASWLCGKKSSSLVALVVLAMWVGTNIARFSPLPQGAVSHFVVHVDKVSCRFQVKAT